MVDETGFGFYYQPNFNPRIQDLYDRRDQMGVRTFVNTIETIGNPANADVHLGSFYHLAFAKKLTDTITESERLDYSRAIFFQGMEGYDDIRPGYTKVAEWDRDGDDGADSFEDYEIETANYGMAMEAEDLEVDDVTADSASITEAVLSGEREGTLRRRHRPSTARSECTPARMSITSRTDSSGHARSLPTAVRKPCSKTSGRSEPSGLNRRSESSVEAGGLSRRRSRRPRSSRCSSSVRAGAQYRPPFVEMGTNFSLLTMKEMKHI